LEENTAAWDITVVVGLTEVEEILDAVEGIIDVEGIMPDVVDVIVIGTREDTCPMPILIQLEVSPLGPSHIKRGWPSGNTG
jgi:hypothetical protein